MTSPVHWSESEQHCAHYFRNVISFDVVILQARALCQVCAFESKPGCSIVRIECLTLCIQQLVCGNTHKDQQPDLTDQFASMHIVSVLCSLNNNSKNSHAYLMPRTSVLCVPEFIAMVPSAPRMNARLSGWVRGLWLAVGRCSSLAFAVKCVSMRTNSSQPYRV